MKKALLLPLILLLIFSLVSCKSDTVSISVEIVCDSENFSISDYVELPDNADSAEYFRQLCNKNDILVNGVDEGFITDINGIENIDDFAWMFYINDELAEVGTKNYVPENGDKISLKYINWRELFTE